MSKKVNQIIEQIREGYKPEKIILFGSHAHGKPKKLSDVDLVVIKRTKDRYWDRIRKIVKCIDVDIGTDLLAYTPKEWKRRLSINDYFVKEIAKTGKVVYEKQ